MGTSLGKMVARLMDQVPARDGLPSATQYEDAVMDALADFGRRAGMVKTTTLSIQAGTASYELPVDFVRMIRLHGLGTGAGVLITQSGLVPVLNSFQERYNVAGRQITFFPTPEYSMSRALEYQAGYPVVDGEIEDLERGQADVALLRAQAMCLTWQANRAAQEAWQYQMGDQRVSKERLAAEIREQARELEGQYQAGVSAVVGFGGSRGWM